MGGFWSHFSEMERLGEVPEEDQGLCFGHAEFEIFMRQQSGKNKYAFGNANLEAQGEV